MVKRGRKPKTQPPAPVDQVATEAPASATRQQHFARLAGLLQLKPQHADSLGLLCRLLSEHDALIEELGEKPSDWFQTTESGYESERPQLRAVNVVRGRMLELFKLLGLVPARRSVAKPAATESPADPLRIFAMQRRAT